jgi:hypothetical protein
MMKELLDPILVRAFFPCVVAGVVAMSLAHLVSMGHTGHRRCWTKLKHLTWLLPLAAVMCFVASQAFNPKQRWSPDLELKQIGVAAGIVSVLAWWPACLIRWAVYGLRNRNKQDKTQNKTNGE